MEIKDKFLKVLHKRLNTSQKKLLSLISVETRKDSLVFRMPIGVITLEGIWSQILEVSQETRIKVSKAGIFATLDELDELLGDIQWLWEGWIPKGFITMIAGDPGIGKSAIAQHLVKIITEGETFPLEEKPLGSPQNVVWVDTEAAQQILKVRGDTMQINKKRVFLPVIHGDLLGQTNLGVEQDREQIINLIEGVEPTMLVLDSLGGSHSRGENKTEEMRPVMEFLATIARDYQIAVLVVHHLNKDRKDESPEVSLYRVRGSTLITGYCRSIFALEKSLEKNIRLRMIKSNLAVIGDPILARPLLDSDKNFTGFNYEPYIPPPPKKNKKDLCAEWVYNTLSKSKNGIALTELVEMGAAPGFSRANIYSTRETLGDSIIYSGTGNKAFWSVMQEDKKTIQNILRNGKNSPLKKKGKHP